jgi:NAD+ kinase
MALGDTSPLPWAEVLMKKIGIITNLDKDSDLSYTCLLADSIKRHGGTALMSDELSAASGTGVPCGSEEEMIDNCDLVVCLGGDGTLLKAARKIYMKQLPIMGINLGNLGYLTEADRSNIDPAIRQLFEGKYEIEERIMLEAVITRQNSGVIRDVAINDVVITRGAVSRILHVKAYINDMFVDTFPGDGLIISSPTGSTAYSLSAGGPIVEPDTDLMIVTPICPHILYTRSFITKADSVVRAVVAEELEHHAMVSLDGREGYDIMNGDTVDVSKSQHTIKLVKFGRFNFFNILRSKIYYRGESLKKDEVQQTRKNTGTD